MEELSVGSSPHFVDHGRLQVQEDRTRDVFSGTSFAEESVEGVITSANGLVGRHLTVRLDTVLQAVEFPAGITDLDTSLTKMNRDTFTLKPKSVNYKFNEFKLFIIYGCTEFRT